MRNLIVISALLLSHICTAQPFTKTPVCSGINYGVAFDVAPDGRFFVTEKGVKVFGMPSQIKVFDAAGNFLSVFYDLTDSVEEAGESGLLGITLDPNFTSNHYVYVYYIFPGDTNNAGDQSIIIERFTEQNNTGTQPVIIFNCALTGFSTANHVGGNIHFRPSDSTHLYVSVGDCLMGYLGDMPAQVNNPLGKILRISKYPNAAPPVDNPFYDDGDPLTGNCDWIWAYGLRNSFDFCFGPNDSLYATENGTQTYDEVNLITRGGFYGWPHCEGSADMDTLTLPCHDPDAIPPLTSFHGPPLPALTGIIFYTGTAWPQQQNHLVTADYNHADLSDVYLTNGPAYNSADTAIHWIHASNLNGITDLWQGPDGCIYMLEMDDSTFGGIYKICPLEFPDSTFTWSLGSAPNPFQTSTTISFTVEQSADVNLSLYDMRGRLVKTFVNGFTERGSYSVELDTQKYTLSSGIYICVMRSEQFTQSLRLVVE